MHSSSSLTLFLKYLYPIGFGLLFVGLFYSEKTTSELLYLAIIFLIISILYGRIFGKLRKVKALHDELITDTISYEETISYDKIIYVYQVAFISPKLIGIKYIDEETGEEKKFFTFASLSDQLLSWDPFSLNEVDLTKFIRRKAKSANPNYNETNEPSRWAPVLYMFAVILIIMVLGNLFMFI